jgi:hypothetical protein
LQGLAVQAFKGAISFYEGDRTDTQDVDEGWELFYENALTLAEVGEVCFFCYSKVMAWPNLLSVVR